jgi:hypothetical protein
VKRFKWPLQRLLDVKVQRERALRGELLALSRQMARLRQEILRRQVVLRSLLAELAGEELQRRIPRQQIFLGCAEADERQIRSLRQELKALDLQRQAKTEQFMKTKASRETLERRREEASRLHMREQLRIEQKQFDETAHVSFARKGGGERRRRQEAGG